MTRFNLWLTENSHSKIVCYGNQCDMNDLCLSGVLGDLGDVTVLPDGEEPSLLTLSAPQRLSAGKGAQS
jgi:hypothetical protein